MTEEEFRDEFPQLKLENQLCFPLYAASRKITGAYTPLLKPLGLTYTQYLVLMVLWEQDTLRVGDLCKRLYLDNGTVSPLLKKMEQEGLVRRTRTEQDERCVTVTPTEQGRALQAEAADIPAKVGQCLNMLSAEEAMSLYNTLYRILGSA